MRSKCFGKELPPLSNFIQTKKFFAWARKGLGTSLALQCFAGFVSSSFPSKISWAKIWQHETKVNYSFFSFLYLLYPYSTRLCAPCAGTAGFTIIKLKIYAAKNLDCINYFCLLHFSPGRLRATVSKKRNQWLRHDTWHAKPYSRDSLSVDKNRWYRKWRNTAELCCVCGIRQRTDFVWLQEL